jgi:hypothetical protein
MSDDPTSDKQEPPPPFGCYRKPSGAVAAFPVLRVLVDPALTGPERHIDEALQVVYVSSEEYAKLGGVPTGITLKEPVNVS